MAEDALRPVTAAPTPSRLLRLVLGPLALVAMGTIWGLGFALAKLAGENGAHPIGLVLWETIGSGATAAAGLHRCSAAIRAGNGAICATT